MGNSNQKGVSQCKKSNRVLPPNIGVCNRVGAEGVRGHPRSTADNITNYRLSAVGTLFLVIQ